MKKALRAFLEGKPVTYEPFKARVWSISPLVLSEDPKEVYSQLSCSIFSKEQLSNLETLKNGNWEITVDDWKFVSTGSVLTPLELQAKKVVLTPFKIKGKAGSNPPDTDMLKTGTLGKAYNAFVHAQTHRSASPLFSRPDPANKLQKQNKADPSPVKSQAISQSQVVKEIDLGEMLTASGGKDSHNVRARVLDFGGFSDTEEMEQERNDELGDFDKPSHHWMGSEGQLLSKRLDDKFELLLSNPRTELDTTSLRKRDNLLTLWSGIKEGLISWQDISFPPAVVERFLQSNGSGLKLPEKMVQQPTAEPKTSSGKQIPKPLKRVKKN